MALRKSTDPGVQEQILAELKAIRSEIVLAATLGGTIAKRGPLDGDGKPATALIAIAKDLAASVKE